MNSFSHFENQIDVLLRRQRSESKRLMTRVYVIVAAIAAIVLLFSLVVGSYAYIRGVFGDVTDKLRFFTGASIMFNLFGSFLRG